MSYARLGADGSDVYVFASVGGYVECCGCLLGGRWDFHSAADVVAHLREHIAEGHSIPAYLLDPALYPAEDFEPYEATT